MPLMLAEGIAFVVLRRVTLYPAQIRSRKESPVHRAGADLGLLMAVPVSELVLRDRPFLQFSPATPVAEVAARIADAATWQDAFPLVDTSGKVCGIITPETLRLVASAREAEPFTIAADIARRPVTIDVADNLGAAIDAMLAHHLRELPVVDQNGRIVGFLDEADIFRAYIAVGTAPEPGR